MFKNSPSSHVKKKKKSHSNATANEPAGMSWKGITPYTMSRAHLFTRKSKEWMSFQPFLHLCYDVDKKKNAVSIRLKKIIEDFLKSNALKAGLTKTWVFSEKTQPSSAFWVFSGKATKQNSITCFYRIAIFFSIAFHFVSLRFYIYVELQQILILSCLE